MSDQPKITANKVTYFMPLAPVGTDDQGRTLVICPFCHDEAYVGEDGRVVCEFGEAMNACLAEAGKKLDGLVL